LAPVSLDHPFYSGLAEEHRLWLRKHSGGHLKKWNDFLQNDCEGALSEAGLRRFLEANNVTVEPGEGYGGRAGGPDFRCLASGQEFFVEVTNIPEAKAHQATGYTEEPFKVRRFSPLNSAVFEKCDAKTRQCSTRNGPVLLAVATFSGDSMTAFSPPYPEMLLTGIIDHFVEIDKITGKVTGEFRTSDLEAAPFLNLPEDTIEPTRKSISGVLLCGLRFGFFVGVLNPFARYPFDPSVLPNVPFDSVKVEEATNTLRINPQEEA
jgi:hypothetical protein